VSGSYLRLPLLTTFRDKDLFLLVIFLLVIGCGLFNSAKLLQKKRSSRYF